MPTHRTHHHRSRVLLALLGAVCLLLCLVPAAHAAGPQLSVSLTHGPATFLRADLDDGVFVNVTNTGDAPTDGPVSATLVLPAALQIRNREGGEGGTCPSVDTCTTQAALAPGETQTVMKSTLLVAADAPGELTTSVTGPPG